RDEIGEAEERSTSALQPYALHRARVSCDCFHAQTRHDFVISFFQLKLPGFLNGSPVLRHVTGAVTLVRLFGMLVFSARDEVTRVWKRRNSAPALIKFRVAARMVKMQVRVDDDSYLFRIDAR